MSALAHYFAVEEYTCSTWRRSVHTKHMAIALNETCNVSDLQKLRKYMNLLELLELLDQIYDLLKRICILNFFLHNSKFFLQIAHIFHSSGRLKKIRHLKHFIFSAYYQSNYICFFTARSISKH